MSIPTRRFKGADGIFVAHGAGTAQPRPCEKPDIRFIYKMLIENAVNFQSTTPGAIFPAGRSRHVPSCALVGQPFGRDFVAEKENKPLDCCEFVPPMNGARSMSANGPVLTPNPVEMPQTTQRYRSNRTSEKVRLYRNIARRKIKGKEFPVS